MKTLKKNTRPTLLLLCLIILSGNSLLGQVRVYDIPLDSIKQYVIDNPEYLTQVNQKTIHPDTIITTEEYFYLYYGSAYLQGYSPYLERSSAIVPYEFLNQEKYQEVIDICKSQIIANPGFVRPFYFLGVAYEQLGDTISAQKFYKRFYDFLSIPYYSGTGNSADSAFVVRSIDDEYIIVGELGLESESQALIFENDIPFDILYVRTQNDTIPQEMYFNITQPYLLGLGLKSEKEDNKKDEKKPRKDKNKKSKD